MRDGGSLWFSEEFGVLPGLCACGLGGDGSFSAASISGIAVVNTMSVFVQQMLKCS